MKLSDIIKDIQVRAIQGSADVEIVDVDIDSRRVKEGHLFVAIPGTQTDGHQYVGKALEQGAVAVLCEHIPEGVPTDKATFVVVDSTEAAIGPVATAFQGYPTQKLKLVGVTGTNGKTTIATLL